MTFEMSFFRVFLVSTTPLHERSEFHCLQVFPRGPLEKTTLVWPCIAVFWVTEQVSSFSQVKRKFQGDWLAHTKSHWEIQGRFRKRVVLANVPSFRFSFRGNIRQNHPFANHPFVNTKKGHWEIKGRFPKGRFWRTYPRSGFRSGGTSAKTTLLETTLLRTPENQGGTHLVGPIPNI